MEIVSNDLSLLCLLLVQVLLSILLHAGLEVCLHHAYLSLLVLDGHTFVPKDLVIVQANLAQGNMNENHVFFLTKEPC